MNRREFIAVGTAGALGLLHDPRNAGAQTPAPPAVPYGQSRLGISDDDRDGTHDRSCLGLGIGEDDLAGREVRRRNLLHVAWNDDFKCVSMLRQQRPPTWR